jgi:hypothetical protein
MGKGFSVECSAMIKYLFMLKHKKHGKNSRKPMPAL